MTKIIVNPDCGNAPKKHFLKDLNIAFARGNIDFIIDHLSDDFQWTIFGDKTVEGKQQAIKELTAMKQQVAERLTIHTIVTHGAEAAVNGEIDMGHVTYAFCDVYQFKSAGSKVLKALSSYVIRVE